MIYAVIDGVTYNKISVVSFAPETNPMSDELPINVCVINELDFQGSCT